MILMDRIKIRDFLSKSAIEQRKQIEELQKFRLDQIAQSRAAKRTTKSAKKNQAKRGKKVKDPQEELIKLLEANPELAEQLQKKLRNEK